MLKSLVCKENCKIYFHYGLFDSSFQESDSGSLIEDFNFINEIISFFQDTFKDIFPSKENFCKLSGILNVFNNKIRSYGKQANTTFYSQSTLDEFQYVFPTYIHLFS